MICCVCNMNVKTVDPTSVLLKCIMHAILVEITITFFATLNCVIVKTTSTVWFMDNNKLMLHRYHAALPVD